MWRLRRLVKAFICEVLGHRIRPVRESCALWLGRPSVVTQLMCTRCREARTIKMEWRIAGG